MIGKNRPNIGMDYTVSNVNSSQKTKILHRDIPKKIALKIIDTYNFDSRSIPIPIKILTKKY